MVSVIGTFYDGKGMKNVMRNFLRWDFLSPLDFNQKHKRTFIKNLVLTQLETSRL